MIIFAIMQELMETTDQVKSMETRTKDTQEFAFLAEARLRSAAQSFYREAEQNAILADMAKQRFLWYRYAYAAHGRHSS
ncbi:MAG: hypothetical protein ACKPKO_55925, partial [Candidatus Fonsibacter sp.]